MIGSLRGKVLFKQPPELVLEVNGVGYELQASMNTFYQLPADPRTEVLLHTHHIVREDAQTLFAFSSLAERALFRHLLKVNGVGPKMALGIVSGMTETEFRQFIHAGDTTALSRIPGVGKKTAERLIVEMRDRLPAPQHDPATDSHDRTNIPPRPSTVNRDEALNALLALGYKPVQASKMIAPYENQDLPVEQIIRRALRQSLS